MDLLKAALPEGFEILSGDDPLTIEFMKRGAVGLVSVASNIIPQTISDLVRHMNAGEVEKAQAIHDQHEELMNTLMGIDVNPIPVKMATALMSLTSEEIRLPLVSLPDDKTDTLRTCLLKYGLI